MECDGRGRGLGRNTQCADTEICSCGLMRPCPEGQPICVKRPEFNQSVIPTSFMVGYFGDVKTDRFGGETVETVDGMVYQDIRVKGDEKFRKTSKYKNKHTGVITKEITELVVKRNDGYSYVKVSRIFMLKLSNIAH